MDFPKLVIDPPVIAHRGASFYAPENTLSAFRKAKELGVNWVEFDVMLTEDDEVVVIHDETLERTTTGKGQVSDVSLEQLKKLDAGLWFAPDFVNEKVPSLLEVITLLNQLQLAANIEIKAQRGREELTVKKVLTLVDKHWQNAQSPLISSFSHSILATVRAYSAESLLGFLMHEWDESWQQQCDALQAISVNVNQQLLTIDRVQQIKATQRMLMAYTVNDINRAQELFAWGVDVVFSDDPLAVIPAISSSCS